MNDLEIGKDYREVVGLPKPCKMVYVGDDTWECTTPDGTTTRITSATQTAKLREYVCQAPVLVGTWGQARRGAK